MTYQDIINLVAAGFTKNDIASMAQQAQPQQAQHVQQVQQAPPQQVQHVQQVQQAPPQQVQQVQQAPPQQVQQVQQAPPQQVQQVQQAPPQQVQQVQQVQPQPTQTEADMLAIIQRINASQAGLDIPPARTSSDILSDHLMEMFDSNRNSQNGAPSSGQNGK